ncbi:MAG TPA: hypothetical protein VFS56_08865 [Gemmatimonadaceae bacterium]|nr:hypothetical protein [Gemmatimonadaceae bacterium]
MGDLQIALPVLSAWLLVAVLLYRSFRRGAAGVSWVFHVAAVIAITLGAVTATAGLGHSIAVVSLTMREPEYGPLQILRLTTGAMLVYAGAMSAALYRGIKVGQRSAIGVGAATASLLVVYLLLLLPAGGRETVPPMLGLWTIYLLSLGTAGIAAMRGAGGAHRPFNLQV